MSLSVKRSKGFDKVHVQNSMLLKRELERHICRLYIHLFAGLCIRCSGASGSHPAGQQFAREFRQ